ncbi:MAG: transglutaminase domain-containing protein [Candidatus Omnitrophota bacterium]
MSFNTRPVVKRIIFSALIATICVSILNIQVVTSQGVNGKVTRKKIPLYLKSFAFVYRHLEYRQLVDEIVKGKRTEKEKTLAIFDWTCENILKVPEGYPVFDDHILNIIIRGYGANDQSNDVFCNLCNYAGIKATWFMTQDKNSRRTIAVSFVKIGNKWRFFDSYRHLYFLNDSGEIASLEDLAGDPGIIQRQAKDIFVKDIPYADFMEGLKNLKWIDNRRFRLQTPLGRVWDLCASKISGK